jgi:hypothetical protein
MILNKGLPEKTIAEVASTEARGDVVDKLRHHILRRVEAIERVAEANSAWGIMLDAANEIEQLRRQNKELRDQLNPPSSSAE